MVGVAMAELAWLIPLFPLMSWLTLALAGRRLGSWSDKLACVAVAVSCALSLTVFTAIATGGRAAGSRLWAVHGDQPLFLGYQVDALTAVMLVVVTLVSLLVHVYSIGYMHGDARYLRYYAVLSLFTAAMLGLVIADNFALLFICWELVGLCSFLLIGHWYERKEAALAAVKAFITTRFGDIALLLGILILYTTFRTFSFTEIQALLPAQPVDAALVAAALLVFAGAAGKSAQFPLHVWLPDAMAGPTPASALIHTATMVAAGVYLVARAYPLFTVSPGAMATMAWTGAITALFAAAIGLVMTDIKRVLAYSTISQLGFMMLALGAGGYAAGVFHLTAHAFFKALLFLAAGSVIHAAHTQNMLEMGGLARRMPVVFAAWLVGAGALAGLPPLSGFWSKEEIMLAVLQASPPLFWLAAAAAFCTACYIGRATILTFLARPRHSPRVASTRGLGRQALFMIAPLAVLAVPAASFGLLNSPVTGHWFARFLSAGQVDAATSAGLAHAATSAGLAHATFAAGPAHAPTSAGLVLTITTLAWALGFLVAWLSQAPGFRLPPAPGFRLPPAPARLLRPFQALLQNRFYIDELYSIVFVRGTLALAGAVARFDAAVVDRLVNAAGAATVRLATSISRFDRSVVDGAVNGLAVLTRQASRISRRLQTGYIQQYALALFTAMVAGLIYLTVG
jgi:NADH-quinone oxidoreductase subunit L